MWFYPLLLVLVVMAVVGGTLAGGVYTIVLIPLAVIALACWAIYSLWGRALAGRPGASTEQTHGTDQPLPHRERRPTGRVRTTPERLVDARRQEQ
jgi:uncharacterized membrane protein YfcA